MASVFGHGLVGYTISKLSGRKLKWLVLMAIISAILPDIDMIAFEFGIPYAHPLGHRGFTHSLLFAILWATLLMFLFGKQDKLRWFLTIFLATVSHGILDAMTSGGRGVGFFIPFHNERFFFSFREIKVSPIGVERFFSEWGLQVIESEIKFILIPCMLILFIRKVLTKEKKVYISKTDKNH